MELLLRIIARCLSTLPLRVNHGIGASLGMLAWVTRTNLRTVTEINLQLCFPDWSAAKRRRVGKASLIETGKALTESFWIWQRPTSDVMKLLSIADGEELLETKLSSKHGLLVATPHIGAWELCALPLATATHGPITCLYQPPKLAALEPIIIKGRKQLGSVITRLDGSGIKHVLSELKNGNTVGLLPDQEPDEKNGVFAPFFQQPANTMTLMAKFANRTEANVIFCMATRKPKGQGWSVSYLEPEEGVGSSDKEFATTALNKTIEHCVLQSPEQYMWNYKRFRRQPDGTRRDYKSKPDHINKTQSH